MSPDLLVRLDGNAPLQRQVYDGLRDAILERRLAPGDRLPASRALAKRLGISRTVVLLAYDQLIAEGYVRGRAGSGTYVSRELPDRMLSVRPRGSKRRTGTATRPVAMPPSAGVAAPLSKLSRRLAPEPAEGSGEACKFDFRTGTLAAEDFPAREWLRLLGSEVRGSPPHYGEVAGYAPLRRAVAAYLRRSRGVRCHEDDVVIVTGARQAFDLVARLVVDPGDSVALEDPHYDGARAALVAAGARLRGIEVDAEGLRVDSLVRSRARPRLVYVTPSHQFPTGAILPLSRRVALLDWAARHGVWILEDDYDAEFQYDVRPVPSLQGLDGAGCVIYVGTFSKVLSPAIRVAYVVAPRRLRESVLALKRIADRHTPSLEQRVLARFMEDGGFERHLRRVRRRHGARRSALVAAVDESFGDDAAVLGAGAGVHALLRLRAIDPALLEDVVSAARRAGVELESSPKYYLRAPHHAELLLGYASMDEPAIREGVRRIAECVRAVS